MSSSRGRRSWTSAAILSDLIEHRRDDAQQDIDRANVRGHGLIQGQRGGFKVVVVARLGQHHLDVL